MSPRDDRNRTQIPRLPSSCFLLIVLLSTHPRAPSVKGWRREWTHMSRVGEVEAALKVPRNHSVALSFVLAEDDESSRNHSPRGPRTGTRYCPCANSLFLILGLSFSPSPFRPAPPLSPPHCAGIPLSGSAPHFPAAVPAEGQPRVPRALRWSGRSRLGNPSASRAFGVSTLRNSSGGNRAVYQVGSAWVCGARQDKANLRQ